MRRQQTETRRGPTFVEAADPYELPERQTPVIPIPEQAGPQAQIVPVNAIDTGTKSFSSVQGKPQDQAQALLIRFAVVAAVLFATTGGIFTFAVIKTPIGSGEAVPAWLIASGLMSLGAWVWMDRSDKQHSPAGTERHKADKAADVAITTNKDQVQAWRDVELNRWSRHYDVIENQQRIDAAERQQLLDERRRLNG